MADSPILSSVTNAVRVLKAFSAQKRSFGVSELARKLELSTSTTHRLLATLAAERMVEQHPETGRYQLGLAVYDLMAATTEGFTLTEAVLPPMTVLRRRTGETVQVAVLDRREVVYVERLESPRSVRMFMEIGRRNQAHCTGTGKALLAYLDPVVLDRTLDGWDLPAKTPKTFTDPDDLRSELRATRTRGYATNVEESEIGAVSVGAPLWDQTGSVVAAMSVAGPTERMLPALSEIAHTVLEAAAVASRRLGHRSPIAGRPDLSRHRPDTTNQRALSR
ncbi:IclR family transcriptional regulator [Euzebya tangerina]|uniref:IclR family transcriptional regulator n=1 Tax=Euzebya tangerina TaxID=591198 RepID=UPI000E30ECB3|nr:IclR family transcriptional regulator [Euzebya tangerina]